MRMRSLTASLLLFGVVMPVSARASDDSAAIQALRREMLEMRAQMQGQISDLRRELARERASRGEAGHASRRHDIREARKTEKPADRIAHPAGIASNRFGKAPVPAVPPHIARPSRTGTVETASLAYDRPSASSHNAVSGKAVSADTVLEPRGIQSHDDAHLVPPPDHGLNMSLADFRRATATAETVSIGGIRIGFPRGRPTIASDDGLYAFSIGLVMHLDIGGFLSSGGSVPGQTGYFPKLNENARRLRVPLTWRYGNLLANLTPEWGRTVDGTAGLYEANMVYAGVKNTQFTLGYYQPRVTMQDSESSNGFMFMERATVSEVVRLIAAGDTRLSLGGRSHGNRWYLGAYLTGQTYGDRTNDPTVSDSQVGGLVRVAYRPVATPTTDLHIGLSSTMSFKRNQTAQGRVLSLSDRPETRLTNERLISTGTIRDVARVWAVGPELAFRYKAALVQAEYYHIGVNRDDTARLKGPAPDLGFEGYYVAGSYALFGRPRQYSQKDGAFLAPSPTEEFDLHHGALGALEVTGRWSVMDFNSNVLKNQPATLTGGVRGGVQTVWSGGLNWYPNRHYRVQLQYSHIMATRSQTVGTVNLNGRAIDVIGTRFQAAF